MKLQVFDPAMCCTTGVCGPGVDPQLARIAADLEWLKSKGINVERYNLAQDVAQFASNSTIKQFLNSQGTKCLPMILVDGTVVSQSSYPTREELSEITGVPYEPGPAFKARNPDLVGIGLGNLEAKK